MRSTAPMKGFTIAEMSIAVVILALLLFSAMVPFSTQVDIRNIADTRRSMDSTMDAIVGFTLANGRLPCPADGSIPAGTTGAGTEQLNPAGTACANVPSPSCTAAVGAGIFCSVVPWVTLGTPETDAWGHRFSYRVSPAFADYNATGTWATATSTIPSSPQNQSAPCAPNPAPAAPTSFALCTLGDIALYNRGVSASVPSGSALPVVLISHGKNGKGAWLPTGLRTAAAPAGTDEAANSNGNTTATPVAGTYLQRSFYNRNPTPSAAGCVDPTPPGTASGAPLCEFDDIVTTISSSALIGRMVAAGRLP